MNNTNAGNTTRWAIDVGWTKDGTWLNLHKVGRERMYTLKLDGYDAPPEMAGREAILTDVHAQLVKRFGRMPSHVRRGTG